MLQFPPALPTHINSPIHSSLEYIPNSSSSTPTLENKTKPRSFIWLQIIWLQPTAVTSFLAFLSFPLSTQRLPVFFWSLVCPVLSCLRPFAHTVPSVWNVLSFFGLSVSLMLISLRSLFLLSSQVRSLSYFFLIVVCLFSFEHNHMLSCSLLLLFFFSLIRP